MLKIISLILFALAGYCFWSFNHIPTRARRDLSVELKDIASDTNLGKVLIIYYSLDGNTYNIASRIQKMTNADVFEIETLEAYPSAPAYFWVARQQLKNLPKLKSKTLDISSYDFIIIGSPVWWYTVSTPLLAFLSEYDFKGKIVAPFATHGGNIGSFFNDFREKIKNAKLVDGIYFEKVSEQEPSELNKKILTWLNKLKDSNGH